MKGLIIYHHLIDGKIVNSSAEIFSGSDFDLLSKIGKNQSNQRGKHEKGQEIEIFHTFVHSSHK